MSDQCLVVANQTLGGDALEDAVKKCLQEDLTRFYVLVPQTRLEHESTAWAGGFGIGEGVSPEAMRVAMEENARRQEAESAAARERAERRLALMIEKIEELGGEADGEVRPEEPLEAVAAVLESADGFAQVIISTLPARLSRWLKMDLPSRVSRMTEIPVVTVEARD